MHPISAIGAAASLEFTVFLMAAALYMDLRKAARSKRLWESMKSILETVPEPEIEIFHQRAA